MTITRRSLIKRSSALALALSTPAIFRPSAARAQPWISKNGTIKLGVLFSQSGPLAVVENDSTQVVLFAIDEINANGGVAGMQVEPVVIDAKSDVKVYSEKISQLILSDRVISTIGGYTSASRRAVAPFVMARDHLFYYPTCYEGRECTQNVICTGPLANQHSQDLIPFMVQNFGKRVYFVGSNYIWPKESNKVARVWLEKVGGEVLGEDYVPIGGSEFAPIFNKIRQANPDFIFSTLIGDSDVAMHKQFLSEGFKADKMPIASLTTGEIEVRAMGAEAGAGHFLSAPYFQALDTPTNNRFVEKYLGSKYGGGGVTHYNMEETYLAVYFWKAGLEKALAQTGDIEAITPRMIRDASGGVTIGDEISPEGKVWIDPDNFNMWLRPKIGQCQGDGQFKIIKVADQHVGPNPFEIYPDRGVCKADGLHTPAGTVQKGVL
ncbi:MAG: ABC transporter substrate-binding protein [Mesorhizobium sp. 61-13]|nr:transporter substrate-binding domain-containing protein [Mesorhizobium sp.]OJU50489.1 MAG: ABC transporter substrate-binding protein [Mesorhizobium sp. 61-13]